MPLTESGLWVPHEPLRKKSWKRFVNFSSVVSVLSIVIATATFFTTRYTSQTAQRAYLSYSMHIKVPSDLLRSVKERKAYIIVDYRITVNNLGNTPALRVYHTLVASSMLNPNAKVLFNQDYQPPWVDIPPKGTFNIDGFMFITNDSQALLDPLALFLQGSFSYDDIFRNSHSLSVCDSVYLQGQTIKEGSCYNTENLPSFR
jgi:hypothetical protein